MCNERVVLMSLDLGGPWRRLTRSDDVGPFCNGLARFKPPCQQGIYTGTLLAVWHVRCVFKSVQSFQPSHVLRIIQQTLLIFHLEIYVRTVLHGLSAVLKPSDGL